MFSYVFKKWPWERFEGDQICLAALLVTLLTFFPFISLSPNTLMKPLLLTGLYFSTIHKPGSSRSTLMLKPLFLLTQNKLGCVPFPGDLCFDSFSVVVRGTLSLHVNV